MKALGQHLLIELYGCSFPALDSVEGIRDTMLEVARKVNATVLGVTEHRFQPHGVTVIVAIAESHVSIHTWPEHGYAAMDVFTCGHVLATDEIVEFVQQALDAERAVAMEVKRGILAEAKQPASPLPLPR